MATGPASNIESAYTNRDAGPGLKLVCSADPLTHADAERFFAAYPMTQDPTNEAHNAIQNAAQEIAASLRFPQRDDPAPVPEFDSLIRMIGQLKAVVYPGGRAQEVSAAKVQEDLSTQLADLHHLISKQMVIAFARHFEACEDMANTDCAAAANFSDLKRPQNLVAHCEHLATEFIKSLPQIRSTLQTDVAAAFVGDPACTNFDEVILCYPGLHAVTVYRLAHELYKLDVPFLPRMMTEWVHGETGVDIHPGAQIGQSFFIDHGTGVVIGQTCEIGDHVKVYQGVTLGALSFPRDDMGQLVRNAKRHPTIEDNVVIYANATILGGDTTVGHDSVIGSSVWLTNSVEPHTTVIMEKPKLRMRSQPNPPAIKIRNAE